MQSWRRIIYFILLNILISALTTWAVVTFFLPRNTAQTLAPAPSLVVQPEETNNEMLITQPSASTGAQNDDVGDVVPEVLEIESIIGAGELDTERVFIKHIGEKEVSLLGWQLHDEDGHVFTFPALTIFSSGAVTVFSREGTSTVVELYWGLDEAVWRPGERAFLLDPDGDIQAVYTIP